MPKLSELGQQKVSVVYEPEEPKSAQTGGSTLRLSEMKPDAVTVVSQPKTEAETEVDQIKKRAGSILAPVVAAGRFIDKFTGAPTRAAIGAIQEGGNPFQAFGKQFGAEPELAPTGKEIAAKAGLSTEESITIPGLRLPSLSKGGMNFEKVNVSPAGVAGLGIDVAADPTNLIPMGTILKGTAKGSAMVGKPVVGMAAKGAAHGVDIATGTKIGTGALKYTKEKADAVKMAFSSLFNPKQADDYADMVRIAERNGVNPSMLPEAVEFGPESIVTRASRVRAEGPLGQGQLEKFNEGLRQTKAATEGVIKNIAGGNVISKTDAGAVIRQGYDNAVERLFAGMEDTYNKISAKNPGLRLSDRSAAKLNDVLIELEGFANSRLARGVTAQQKSQAKQLLTAIDAVRSTGNTLPAGVLGPNQAPTFQGIVEVMRNTGEAAYKKGAPMSLDPPDIERLRRLYGDMREAVMETIETQLPDGAQVAANLKQNNKMISDFFDDSSVLTRTIGRKDISDEAIFNRLVEQGDTKKAEALAKILTPAEFQEVKGAFLDSLLAKSMTEDDFTFRGTINRMKSKQSVIEGLFSPEEIKEFTDVLRLGDRFGQPIMSTSGTGASNVFKSITQGVKDSVINDSFINTLKERARAGKPRPDFGAAAGGAGVDMRGILDEGPLQGNGSFFNQAKQQQLQQMLLPSKTELRLKGSRVLSTQEGIDANEGRKEAIRRRILQRGNN